MVTTNTAKSISIRYSDETKLITLYITNSIVTIDTITTIPGLIVRGNDRMYCKQM